MGCEPTFSGIVLAQLHANTHTNMLSIIHFHYRIHNNDKASAK